MTESPDKPSWQIDRRSVLRGLLTVPFASQIKAVGALGEILQASSPIDVIITGVESAKLNERWSKLGYPAELINKFLKLRDKQQEACIANARAVLTQIYDIFPEDHHPKVQLRRFHPSLGTNNNLSGKGFYKVGSGAEVLEQELTRVSAVCDIPGLSEVLNCSNTEQTAGGSIQLEFNPDGTIEVVLTGKTSDSQGNFEGTIDSSIVRPSNNQALEILKIIKRWQLQDWSPIIEKSRKATNERIKNAMDQHNQKITEAERRAQNRKIMNILKGSTHLTSPEETLARHKSN